MFSQIRNDRNVVISWIYKLPKCLLYIIPTLTTALLPTTDMSSSRETITRLSTQTTYSTGHSGDTTNRPSLTKQSDKFTESTTHSKTTTYVISTTHLSKSTKILSAKTTNNATTPAVSKNSTSQAFNKSSKRRSSTTLTMPTTFIKYLDSTIPSSRTVTGPTPVTYSSTNKSSSNPVIVNVSICYFQKSFLLRFPWSKTNWS